MQHFINESPGEVAESLHKSMGFYVFLKKRKRSENKEQCLNVQSNLQDITPFMNKNRHGYSNETNLTVNNYICIANFNPTRNRMKKFFFVKLTTNPTIFHFVFDCEIRKHHITGVPLVYNFDILLCQCPFNAKRCYISRNINDDTVITKHIQYTKHSVQHKKKQ